MNLTQSRKGAKRRLRDIVAVCLLTSRSCARNAYALCMAVTLVVTAPISRGGERIEYEGELRFCSSSSEKGPLPLVHVIVQDGQVQQISYRDRRVEPNRVEVLDFSGKTVIRYQLAPALAGQAPIVYDLTKNGTLPKPAERERINNLAQMLLRYVHFHTLPKFPRVDAFTR